MFSSGPIFDVLRTWHDLFLLVGGASATLLGLVFISVALVSGFPTIPNSGERNLFAAPVLVQFVYALLLAAMCLAPWQSARAFGIATAGVGLGAFIQSVGLFVTMRKRRRVRGEASLGVWFQSVVAPFLVATVWLTSALFVACGDVRAVAGLATAGVGLDLLGIMGAWNLFLWMLTEHHRLRS